MGEQLEKYAGLILAACIGVIAWFSRRDLSRYDLGLDRIAALERNAVTHEKLERILDGLREERAAHHDENREALRRIEDKLDAGEQHSRTSRGEIRQEVHEISLRLTRLEAKL